MARAHRNPSTDLDRLSFIRETGSKLYDITAPHIDLDLLHDLTLNAEVDSVQFDGVDLFLADPHTPIDADDYAIKALADNFRGRCQTKKLEAGQAVI
jgi:hypothetical protein